MANPLMHESIWFDSYKVADAERLYQEKLAQEHAGISVQAPSSLVNEIQKTRQYIKNSLDTQKGTGLAVGVGVDTTEISGRLERLEAENKDLRSLICKLENRVAAIEKKSSSGSAPAAAAAPPAAKPAAAKPAAVESEDDDDDDDLFGSESEDEESKAAAEKLKQERLAAYYAKKAKKPGPIAKSNIILDVKPWDDETDLKEMERLVRAIDMEGLLWGASKFVEVGYGIKKLQITCVVEDDKVGTDDLDEKITGFEDYVQSMDIVAFNKI